MGSNNGTGQPNWFRCSKCRSTVRGGHHCGFANDVELTGEQRPHRSKKGGARITHIDRQYRCLSCGHVGWSCHVELADKAGESPDLMMNADGTMYLPVWAREARS
jgi:hypothetical protein